MTSKRNGKIELLRFVFCICIVLFHAGADVFGSDRSISEHLTFFAHGRIGTEFFFLLSGFLAAKSAYIYIYIYNANNLNNKLSIGDNTYNFIFKKIKTIFPYHIFAIIVSTILLFIYSNNFVTDFIKRIPSIFFLQRTGIDGKDFISVEWYICSMLLALSIIYPMLLKNFDFTAKVISPVGSSLLIGYLVRTYGGMPVSNEFVKYTFSCNIRAFAIVLLGCFCFVISEKIKHFEFSKLQKILLILVENICWLAAITYIVTDVSKFYEVYIVYAFALAITLTFSRDFSCKVYNNKLIYCLGRLSLPIYLCQNIARSIVSHELEFLSKPYKLLSILLLTVVIGIISDFVCGKLKQIKLNKTVSK